MKKNLALSLLLVAMPGLSHGATTFYEEKFPHPSGVGNVAHNTVDWQFHDTSSATDQSGATGSYAVSSGNGIDGAFGYGAAATTTTIAIAWTEEFTSLDRSLTEIDNFSFFSNNTNSSVTMRLAIRLDTTWYVSASTLSNPNGGAGSNFATNGTPQSMAFTTAATDWHLLTLNPGSTLSRATGTLGSALPSDNLTAAGIVFESVSGVIRYDNFKIETIPEPSALLIASLGALAGLHRRR